MQIVLVSNIVCDSDKLLSKAECYKPKDNASSISKFSHTISGRIKLGRNGGRLIFIT